MYIPRNYSTNEPRGFAFVRFVDKRDAEDAQRALDGADIDGREIRIQEVRVNSNSFFILLVTCMCAYISICSYIQLKGEVCIAV